jgi:hypothetical protein
MISSPDTRWPLIPAVVLFGAIDAYSRFRNSIDGGQGPATESIVPIEPVLGAEITSAATREDRASGDNHPIALASLPSSKHDFTKDWDILKPGATSEVGRRPGI